MSGTYFDTSALVKHYHAEAGSPEVDRLWHDPTTALFISRLSVPELVSAFAGKVRTGEITPADFFALTRRFAADARNKNFTTIRLLARHFKEAERQIREHGLTVRLRTLDALQLAVALDLKTHGLVTDFVCSDRGLLSVAAAEGLVVFNPENP
jgi:predicted nucleic acid-binding protein